MQQQLTFLRAWAMTKFGNDERGANLVEYILLIAFIAVVLIATVTALKGAIGSKFDEASSKLSNNG